MDGFRLREVAREQGTVSTPKEWCSCTELATGPQMKLARGPDTIHVVVETVVLFIVRRVHRETLDSMALMEPQEIWACQENQ